MEETLVYIVRLRVGKTSRPGAFRATVLRAGTDELTSFTRCEALASYFAEQARATDAQSSYPSQGEGP